MTEHLGPRYSVHFASIYGTNLCRSHFFPHLPLPLRHCEGRSGKKSVFPFSQRRVPCFIRKPCGCSEPPVCLETQMENNNLCFNFPETKRRLKMLNQKRPAIAADRRTGLALCPEVQLQWAGGVSNGRCRGWNWRKPWCLVQWQHDMRMQIWCN